MHLVPTDFKNFSSKVKSWLAMSYSIVVALSEGREVVEKVLLAGQRIEKVNHLTWNPFSSLAAFSVTCC